MNWCYHDENGLVLSLYIQPKAKRTEVIGIYGQYLKLRVKAPPIDNKANEALLLWLTLQLNIPRKTIHILCGEHARYKRIKIETTLTREWVATQLLLPPLTN